MKASVHLGYELGTGAPIAIPLRHLAVTGQTQESGKTTTLEALATRSGATALTFITKRGEGSFAAGRRVKPYFRDRADWQFVTSILDATLQEKNKFLRPWIMKICRNTETLAEVQERVREALATARGINEGVYTQLDAYLDLIVPEIERADLADRLDLATGINVMDVSPFATPMQMLFIQSALDWVNERCRNTTVVIPEAWEFVPEGKGSPVKVSAITLVRKGAGIGNHIWVDSQDMAGVDKTILRGCTVWIIGVQREANELKRNLSNIPAGIKRPSAADVATLERGQFFACFGQTVAKVYVQPAWMAADDARDIATGAMSIDETVPPAKPQHLPKQQEDEVDRAEADALLAENTRLKTETGEAEQRGYERGMTAGLRQAGEYWNAAALDVRDHARKVTDLAEHLAEVAREGRWERASRRSEATGAAEDQGVPAATSKARPPAEESSDKYSQANAPSRADMAMLDALVRSYPQPLPLALWAVAVGKSPESAKAGPWYRSRNTLLANGFIEEAAGGFRATLAGTASSTHVPQNPQDEVELFALWRDRIAATVGTAAMTMLRVLADHRRHRLTNEQWALLAGKTPASAKAGPWYGNIKALREWALIEGDRQFAITPKGCALFEILAPPRADTAETLRAARYDLLQKSQRHYDALKRPMTRQQLAEALNVSAQSAKAGPWYGAIKEMIESGLVADEGGMLRRVEEDLA
jgi:hypothetical protein